MDEWNKGERMGADDFVGCVSGGWRSLIWKQNEMKDQVKLLLHWESFEIEASLTYFWGKNLDTLEFSQ